MTDPVDVVAMIPDEDEALSEERDEDSEEASLDEECKLISEDASLEAASSSDFAVAGAELPSPATGEGMGVGAMKPDSVATLISKRDPVDTSCATSLPPEESMTIAPRRTRARGKCFPRARA
jgi:hypothetical protein